MGEMETLKMEVKMEEFETMPRAEWPEVMTFEPTMEEFANLSNLLNLMEAKGAHRAGIAKIVPPKEWVARARGYQPCAIDIEIPGPVEQTLSPTEVPGAFQASHSTRPKLKVEEYRRLATKPSYVTPVHQSYEELERLYWQEMFNDAKDPPIYGADVCESITDEEQSIWNIRRLESILTEEMEEQIPGVNMPYLYFGMWRATFSWHVEDMDLYGVNFLHYGAPKTWYCVPPQYAYKLEAAATKLFPGMAQACPNLLRHKAVMLDPDLLEEFGVRVQKVVQEERDMIVVFPHAYHCGFNHGFNIAESTNFAMPRWVEYGKRFRGCLCGDKDKAVSVDMVPFIRRYQPDRLEDWQEGRDFDLHPNDPEFIREIYNIAKLRLQPSSLLKLQSHLKDTRSIPNWVFKELDLEREKFADKVDLYSHYDLSDFVEDVKPARVWSPRHRAAARKLKENLNSCNVRLKPIVKVLVHSHMRKRKRQELYESLEKKVSGDLSDHYKTKVSNGFATANLEDMMAKKALTTCVKKHRFKACTKCKGCRTPNCGKCRSCEDMPAFGGHGTAKQKCMLRICCNPIMRSCEYCKWDSSAI